MPHEVIMPALGMAQDTGLIVSWLKGAGDAVKAGDALFEVETDKATMEVEAPADGFLTNVRAAAGAEVPVGQVIALISESAEDSANVTTAAAEAPVAQPSADTLPQGARIIMPALGMAQDTGLIVAWHKAPGDAVTAGDILFEVETDKSTMEVEAGQDGFVAALLAEAGEEAPVGDVIAIISADKPNAPLQQSIASGTATKVDPPGAAPAPVVKTPAPAAKPAAPLRADGRVLASPKARRLALEEGLDLTRLADAGHPQPFHVRDLDVLRNMPAAAVDTGTGGIAARRLTAQVGDGFSEFAKWVSETTETKDTGALLAGMAAASLAQGLVVEVERFGQSRRYQTGPLLGQAAECEETPDLRLRDMRGTPVDMVNIGPEDMPVLTLTGDGSNLAITLECAAGQLSPSDALALLSNFAGRIADPLRHLL